MPVLPQEEETGKNLTDQIAKESRDSGASDHPLHTSDEQAKAKMEHHQANPGPVMAQNLPEPTSKEENRKRAEELNK